MIAFAHLHPVWAGVIWMSEASIVAFGVGVIAGQIYWNWDRIVSALQGRGDAFQARAAGLRPQPHTASSQSSIDYRGEQG